MAEHELDGPDLEQARSAHAFAQARTGEVAIAVAESRRLASHLRLVGKNNHFAEKFRAIIQG